MVKQIKKKKPKCVVLIKKHKSKKLVAYIRVFLQGGKKRNLHFSNNLESLVRIMIPRRGMKIHNFL